MQKTSRVNIGSTIFVLSIREMDDLKKQCHAVVAKSGIENMEIQNITCTNKRQIYMNLKGLCTLSGSSENFEQRNMRFDQK